MKCNKWVVGLLLSGLSLTVFSGCDPIPRRQLTTAEKVADLHWIFSQYGENYAPLDYKQSRFSFDYEALKLKYLEDAALTKNNDEFYDLMFKFIAEFKDAHNSGALTNASFPNRALTAYLGFSGTRDGDALLVKKLLPSIKVDGTYPVKVDDRILALNGKTLKDIALKEMLKYRDLGHEEANITYHMNKIFNRVSTVNGIPTEDNATLLIERVIDGQKVLLTVGMPWVKKDLFQFQAEQRKATEKKAEEEKNKDPKQNSENYLMIADNNSVAFRFNFIGFNGKIAFPKLTMESVTKGLRKLVTDSFVMVDHFAGWDVAAADGEKVEEKTPAQIMRELREVPAKARFLEEAKVYPAYISKEKNEAGQVFRVGTIYVDSFSPEANPKEALEGFVAALDAFQEDGVEHVVIDMINNGGGSLDLGLKMAYAMTNQPLKVPGIQFKTSDSWMDEFESASNTAQSDVHREIARRVLVSMEDSKKKGDRLSQSFPVTVLAPYSFAPNYNLKKPFKVALLVNEMCASMCDIFTAILKDNGLATVVGTRTMGAGGNVVNYNQAPNSHIDVRMTESLIQRADGSYIENNGVEADVKVNVNESAKTKYSTVREAALKAILPAGTPTSTTVTPLATL